MAAPSVPSNSAAQAVAQRVLSGNEFAFDDDDDDLPLKRPSQRQKKGGGIFVALGIAFLLLAVGGGIGGYFLYNQYLVDPANGDHIAEDPDRNNPPDGPIDGGKKTDVGGKKTGSGKLLSAGFPRRALLISVNNYLFFNPVHYGVERQGNYSGSSTGVLVNQFALPPMNIPAKQIFELSDGNKNPHPVQKVVIETTIKEFLEASRPQDRVVLLFSGHATEIEKEAYLIPIEGRKDDAKTLIPLKWVYEQLAKCPARQKLLVVDVNRYSPARGFELPGAGASDDGEMGEVLDEMLKTPPAGVQVWCSCTKGQRSIEFENGSIFLQAICRALQKGGITKGISAPTDPFPLEALMAEVNNSLKKQLVDSKDLQQQSRISGSENSGGSPYDPTEPPPVDLVLKQPPTPSEGVAGQAQINGILNELKALPPVRETRAGEERLLVAANLPAFPAKVLQEYQSDNERFIELQREFAKDPAKLEEYGKKFPIRAAVFESIGALKDSNSLTFQESLYGPISDQIKADFLKKQRDPGKVIFKLENALDSMESLKEMRDKETNKRWLAHFDYAMARLQSRLVYIYEYNFILGQIRSDSLPTLENGQNGWRIGAAKKVSVQETRVKKMAKEIAKTWKGIQEEYPETPWAVLAHRESLIAIGLEWRSKAD